MCVRVYVCVQAAIIIQDSFFEVQKLLLDQAPHDDCCSADEKGGGVNNPNPNEKTGFKGPYFKDPNTKNVVAEANKTDSRVNPNPNSKDSDNEQERVQRIEEEKVEREREEMLKQEEETVEKEKEELLEQERVLQKQMERLREEETCLEKDREKLRQEERELEREKERYGEEREK